MELKRFKEKNPKKVGIILFTISCILLISGVILYRTFAIFQVNENQNMIEGNIQDEGDIRFMVYIDDVLQKDVPSKDSGYSLDTSTSYCDNGDLISWDDENWEVRLKNISTTKTKCYLKFKQIYKEETLNGAIPDLGNGRLIPVKISDTEKPSDVTEYTNAGNKYGGKVTKADITSEWYNYSKQQWANAVILKDGKVDNYHPEEEIKESDIESYFVWIPRYRYQLKFDEATYNKYTIVEDVESVANIDKFYEIHSNLATNSVFEITFETKNEGIKTGSTKENWITHPAFSSFDSNGFWVGKFETGYNGANSKETAQINKQEVENVIIKPNIYSWRYIDVSNAFYTSYTYQRDLESHMMKNTEWGAVAYLTQSIYGRCPNKSCTEVRMNNSENYITGMSAKSAPTCGYTNSNETCNHYETTELNKDGDFINSYYNFDSKESSTTGNYYGIYDMSGGAWEYVMGVMQGTENGTTSPSSGRSKTYNSGFKGPYSCPTCDGNQATDKENTTGREWPSSKYYDLYDYKTNNQEYQRGILGDATKEFGPFYRFSYQKTGGTGPSRYVGSYNANYASFVYSSFPWFLRGGTCNYGSDAGVFAFGIGYGCTGLDGGFRIILTP